MSCDKAQPGTVDEGLGVVKDGWFTELSTMWPGQGLSLEVEEVLFHERSKFQVSDLPNYRVETVMKVNCSGWRHTL